MGNGFEDGGETDDWSSRVHGFKERSRFKGVSYSTSLAGVNDHGATNKRSADSPSRRVILLRFDAVLTVVTSKTQRAQVIWFCRFPLCPRLTKFIQWTSHTSTTTLGPACSHKPPPFWKLGPPRPPRPDHAAVRSPDLSAQHRRSRI
jgi:hypothetical protein